jgi:phenylalanine-4-hydroxylase
VAIFSRLYWFTVEFGVAREEGALKLYGAGLASSFGEAAYALDSARPERLPFDLERVLRTPYRSDAFQPLYYVVDGLDTLRTGIDLDRLEESFDAL